jgi:hypothetical protein
VPVFIDGTKRDIVGWAGSDEGGGMPGYSRQGRKPLAYVALYRAKHTGARSGPGRWTCCVEKMGRRPCLRPPLVNIL